MSHRAPRSPLLHAPCLAGLVAVAVASAASPEPQSTLDATAVRTAYQSARHAIHEAGGAWQASNPGQRWAIRFDGHGVSVTPTAGDWSWGLDLVRCGRTDARPLPTGVPATSVDGGRIAYRWDETLSEWWRNGVDGLEHGWTLAMRPPGDGPIVLELAVRGELCAESGPDQRSASFGRPDGHPILRYGGLAAIDATGATLPAWLFAEGDSLRIVVDDRAAAYPVTIDPLAQQAYLKASNTEHNDFFGQSAAISGDTVVIGASQESGASPGVDGDQSSNGAPLSGAAYVFVRSGSTWVQQAYLKASNPGAFDLFGLSVAISGDTIVVGALREDSMATGVDGDQADNGAIDAGAAYVFVRHGATWTQEAYLKASNTDPGDNFGESVAVSGNTIVVGASIEASSASGVDGDQSDNSKPSRGAAYVFRRDGTVWTQEAYLKPAATVVPRFGGSVAASNDTLLIGALNENAPGPGGVATAGGAAYVFTRGPKGWIEEAHLHASNAGHSDQFGGAVALAGDTAVMGASNEDSAATGVDGDQANNSSWNAGAAYVFARSGGTWSQTAYLKASNTGLADHFGGTVGTDGSTVVVGAWGEASSATGVDGDQYDNSKSNAGAAYVFTHSRTGWCQVAYLKASNTDQVDHFSTAIAVTGPTIVLGARDEDSAATGIDGEQADNSAPDAGAAYVYEIAAGTPGDLDGDGEVGATDLSILLGAWGSAGPGDIDGSGLVDAADLGLLLLWWGP